MGYGQFMPSSYKQRGGLLTATGTLICGSGGRDWQCGELFQTARLGEWRSGCGTGAGPGAGLENGFKTNYSISQLTAAGLTPTQPLGNHQQASLVGSLDIGTVCHQYWYGLPNFSHHYPL